MFFCLCFVCSDYRGRYLFNEKEEKEIKNNGYYNDNKLKDNLSLSIKERLKLYLTNQNNLEESADDFKMRKDYEDLQSMYKALRKVEFEERELAVETKERCLKLLKEFKEKSVEQLSSSESSSDFVSLDEIEI